MEVLRNAMVELITPTFRPYWAGLGAFLLIAGSTLIISFVYRIDKVVTSESLPK